MFVTFGLIAGGGYDAFLFDMGLSFGATASCVHPAMVDAENHTIPEALATCHRALEGERKREKTHRQSLVYSSAFPT